MLIGLIKEHKGLAVAAVALGLVVAVLESATAALMMPLILFLGEPSSRLETGSSHFLDGFLHLFHDIPEEQKLTSVVILIVALTVAKNVSFYFSNISNNKLMLNLGFSIRRRCIEFFLNQRLTFFSKSEMGELLSCVNEHVQRSELMASYLLSIVNNLLVLVLLFSLLIILSPALTVYVVLAIAGLGVFLRLLFKAVSSSGNRAAKFIGQFTSLVTEIIGGMRVVKALNGKEKARQRTVKALQDRYGAELKAWKLQSAVGPITETVGTILVLGILSIGVLIHSEQSAMALPLVITYVFALLRMWPRLNHLNGIRAQFFQMKGSLMAIEGLLSRIGEIEPANGTRPFYGLKNAIEFKDVSYTFPGRDTAVLSGVSFCLKKGTVTALVGPSGGGKSTLADLLLRFDDPGSGCIAVDGVDLKEIERTSWRKGIGLVSQDTFLFNATVRENIAYGLDEASEADIVAAAEAAYAYEFIQGLPNGFDTVVGDRGTMLSGGQRQRIAIARAILRNPEILVFDEATSALDFHSERAVQLAIEAVSKDRTVLIIAHRISTIRNADNIIFVADGKILEQGTAQDLMELKGKYFELNQIT